MPAQLYAAPLVWLKCSTFVTHQAKALSPVKKNKFIDLNIKFDRQKNGKKKQLEFDLHDHILEICMH